MKALMQHSPVQRALPVQFRSSQANAPGTDASDPSACPVSMEHSFSAAAWQLLSGNALPEEL